MNSEHEIKGPQGRRSTVVEVGGRSYRVTEPPPSKGFRVLVTVTSMLGPMLTKILSGQLRLWEVAVCPKCGAKGGARTAGADQWICEALEGEEGQPQQQCRTVWDKVQQRDPDGQPVVATLGYVLGDRQWRAAIAYQVRQQIESLDPHEADGLMRACLVGNLAMHFQGKWIKVDNLDRVRSGMDLLTLLYAALDCWVLPMLVDDLPDTSPASSTNSASMGPGNSPTPGDSPVPPAPLPGATRAPPPTLRQQ